MGVSINWVESNLLSFPDAYVCKDGKNISCMKIQLGQHTHTYKIAPYLELGLVMSEHQGSTPGMEDDKERRH